MAHESFQSQSVKLRPEHAATLLENFIDYPAPLALLDSEGRMELANERFARVFGAGGVDVSWFEQLQQPHDAQWRTLELPVVKPDGDELRARAVRMRHHILLVVDGDDGARNREVEELRRQLAQLERLAATDHLTGAWNRAHLDHVIETELARSAATAQPLTMILFDVDHFKGINDRYGHVVGDRVLRELAQLARGNLRASDLLFRWGGEEFIVLVSAAGYRSAARVAEKLRAAVEKHAFEQAGSVTISLGVAEFDGRESRHDWFERLDNAMYEAKRAGRNTVIVDPQGASDSAARLDSGFLHLRWQEAYECGDEQIDAEHRELFRLANELIDASLQRPIDALAMSAALGELIAHVQQHFEHEEQTLEQLRYHDLTEHRRAHAGLIRRALQMKADVDNGRGALGDVVEFVAQDVIARHLLVVDRAFFPLFAGR